MTMRIRTPGERAALRLEAEQDARRAMVELLCTVSILRTAVTRVLPVAGSAAWWVTLVALLPGMALCLLMALALKRTGAQTLTELTRRTLGMGGAWATAAILAVLLLHEALSSLTALTALFTQGVGARGTPFTLAAVACGAAALCMKGEGLPRSVSVLRWPLAVGAAVVAAYQLGDVRLGNLEPLGGEGGGALAAALRAGAGMGWPLALLFTVPPRPRRPRLASLGVVTLGTVLPVLMLCLVIPHGLLRGQTLAGALMLPARFAAPAVQTLMYCAELLGFFLAIASAVMLAREQAAAPAQRPWRWTAGAMLALLALTQALDAAKIWQALGNIGRWLLLPLALLTAACLACDAAKRRERP